MQTSSCLDIMATRPDIMLGYHGHKPRYLKLAILHPISTDLLHLIPLTWLGCGVPQSCPLAVLRKGSTEVDPEGGPGVCECCAPARQPQCWLHGAPAGAGPEAVWQTDCQGGFLNLNSGFLAPIYLTIGLARGRWPLCNLVL